MGGCRTDSRVHKAMKRMLNNKYISIDDLIQIFIRNLPLLTEFSNKMKQRYELRPQ